MPAIGACASPRSAVYRRCQPERKLLYRTVQTHLATWLALRDDGAGETRLVCGPPRQSSRLTTGYGVHILQLLVLDFPSSPSFIP